MKEIIPAILPKSYEDMKGKLGLIHGLTTAVQIDLCDGKFVKSITWPFRDQDQQTLEAILNEQEGMPYWDEFDFEFDLMVADATKNIEDYIKLGAKRLVFHFEAQESAEDFKEFMEGIDLFLRDNIEIGVGINITTPIEEIFPIVNSVDFIQCMGIDHIGSQGEEFDERVYGHIKALKEKFPDVVISVDGGVSFENAQTLLDAGVDRLIVGSAIFNSVSPQNSLEDFQSLTD